MNMHDFSFVTFGLTDMQAAFVMGKVVETLKSLSVEGHTILLGGGYERLDDSGDSSDDGGDAELVAEAVNLREVATV